MPTLVKSQTTFAVDRVKPATTPLPEVSYRDGVLALLSEKSRPLDSWSQSSAELLNVSAAQTSIHSFLFTVNRAYNDHRPLILSPDMLWLLIVQGVALHVYANAEQLRSRFVTHTGKLLLEVRRDEFVKGFVGNDWEGVFAEFSEKIKAYIGENTHSLLVQNFSTTGIVEKAAMEVVLMDTLQSYFVFGVTTECGIPAITLEGTPEDWHRVRDSAACLQDFDLDWWIPHLLPVLDQFVEASQGNVQQKFWQEFYKLSGGSGGPYIQGHSVNLFPYLGRRAPNKAQLERDLETFLRNSEYLTLSERAIQMKLIALRQNLKQGQSPTESLHRNPYIGGARRNVFDGIKLEDVGSTLSTVPFFWNYYGTIYPMEFLAGFVGTTQNAETLALRPEIGWAVREGVVPPKAD